MHTYIHVCIQPRVNPLNPSTWSIISPPPCHGGIASSSACLPHRKPTPVGPHIFIHMCIYIRVNPNLVDHLSSSLPRRHHLEQRFLCIYIYVYSYIHIYKYSFICVYIPGRSSLRLPATAASPPAARACPTGSPRRWGRTSCGQTRQGSRLPAVERRRACGAPTGGKA